MDRWYKNKWFLFAVSALATALLCFLIFILFLKPPVASVIMKQGTALYKEKDYSAAIEKYETALKLDGRNEDIYRNYAKALIAVKEYDRAIEVLDQGMDMISGAESLYAFKSKVYVEAGRIGAAIDFLDSIEDDLVNRTIQKMRPGDISYTPMVRKYNTSQTITLEAGEGETIYYTVSNQPTSGDPTLSSNVYTAPLTISSNTSITAVAINEDGLVSPRLTLYYEIDNPNEPVKFTDKGVEQMVRAALGKSYGEIKIYQLQEISSLASVDGTTIQSLEELSYLTSLTTLVLNDQRGITDYSVLGRLPSLADLTIYDCGIGDAQLAQISTCERLRQLNVCCNYITSLSSIREMTFLEQLDVSENQISTLGDLNLTELTHLDLRTNQLTSLNGLQKLKKLTSLNISENNISDLSPIAELTDLEQLWMQKNAPTNLKKLASLKKLSMLDITKCGLRSINELSSLPALQELIANGNKISDLSGFTRKVTKLQLKNNPIEDLTSLKNQSNLQFLYLNGTEITDLSPLQSLSKLTDLDVSDTEIFDATMLKNCPALSRLTCPEGTNVSGLPASVNVNFN